MYKHRVSMPSEEGDALRAVTEASALGAQLLSLRAANGHSRFLLLPRPPDGQEQPAVAVAETEGPDVAEAALLACTCAAHMSKATCICAFACVVVCAFLFLAL